MYISLEVVNVWHHVITCACLRCVWISVQAGTVKEFSSLLMHGANMKTELVNV
jgi:hypothetical protein